MISERDTAIALRRFLSQLSVGALATVDDAGLAHLINVYVSPDNDARFYFVSDPGSAHSRYIAQRPQVQLVACAPGVAWSRAHGIQVAGRCQRLTGPDQDAARRIYGRHFPFAAAPLRHARAVAWYRITPTRIRWIDNRVHFGFKRTFHWPLGPT